MTCPALNCYFWESGCSLDWTITAAWVQAIASVAAIWWASKTSLTQVALQFKNDQLIRERESIQEQIIVVNALYNQIDNIKGAIQSFLGFAKQTQISRQPIAKHDANNYRNVFQDALDDIQKISIYGLRNKVIIFLYTAIRFDIRQLQFNSNILIDSDRVYSASDFEEFANVWKRGIESFEGLVKEVKLELERLEKLEASLVR